MPDVVPIGIQAARLLDAGRRNVQYRWVQRIVTSEPYSLRPDLSLVATLGQVGAILDGLSTALRLGVRADPDQPEDALREAVRRHAALRASQGFSPQELVSEFRALRYETWRVLEKGLEQNGVQAKELFELQALLNYAIDTLLLGAVAAWTEARGHVSS